MFMQNTTNITKTRQLLNVFELVAGLHPDSTNTSTKVSTANGTMMSIQNYNDEPKLSTCLSQGCQYFFSISLVQTAESSRLDINCVYSGANGLNEEFVVNKVKLFLNGSVYEKTLEENVVFRGSEKKSIDLGQIGGSII